MQAIMKFYQDYKPDIIEGYFLVYCLTIMYSVINMPPDKKYNNTKKIIAKLLGLYKRMDKIPKKDKEKLIDIIAYEVKNDFQRDFRLL